MRAMELAERGAIEPVVATKRDRLLMDRDLEGYGVPLVALNDTGNRIGDGVQDDFAEYEREQITQRTSAGRHEKARQGKVIASRLPDYGYRYGLHRNSYVVVEEQMSVVRRILFPGLARLGVRRRPGPRGRRRPRPERQHMAEDVRPADGFRRLLQTALGGELRDLGVAPDVLARLDPDASYGVRWYNRRGVRTVRVMGPAGPRKSRRVREKPKWIPVPVPHSGVPRETVDAARAALEGNEKCSKNGGRSWPLSGGSCAAPTAGATS